MDLPVLKHGFFHINTWIQVYVCVCVCSRALDVKARKLARKAGAKGMLGKGEDGRRNVVW